MSEANLWKRMRTGIARFAFAQRLENLVGEGVPDVVLHSRLTGRCAFIELKYRPELPTRSSTPVFKGGFGLRPEQIAFIHGRATAGAAIFVLGQCGEEVWLVHGRCARELSSWTTADLNIQCHWKGSARRTDWEGLLQKIFE